MGGLTVVPQAVGGLGANNIVPFIRGAKTVAQVVTPSSSSSSIAGAIGGGLGRAVLGGVASWIVSELIFTRPGADTSLDGLQQRTAQEVNNGDMTSAHAQALAKAMIQVQQAFPGQKFELVQGTVPGDTTPILALKRGDTVIPLMIGADVVSRPTPIYPKTTSPTPDSSQQQELPNNITSPDSFRQQQQAQQQAERLIAQGEERKDINQRSLHNAWTGSSLAYLQQAYGSLKGQFSRAAEPQIQVTSQDRNRDDYVDHVSVEPIESALQRCYENTAQEAFTYNRQQKDGTVKVVFRHPKNADLPVIKVFKGTVDEVERLVADGIVSGQDLKAVGISGRIESQKERREALQELEQTKRQAETERASNQQKIDNAWNGNSINALEKAYQSFKGQFRTATKPEVKEVSITDRSGDGIGDYAQVESAEAAAERSYKAATRYSFNRNKELTDGTAVVAFRHKLDGAAVPTVTVYEGSVEEIQRLFKDKRVTQEDLKEAGIERRVTEWKPPGQEDEPTYVPDPRTDTQIPSEKPPPEKVKPIQPPGTGIEVGTDPNEKPPPKPEIPQERPQSPPPEELKQKPRPDAPVTGDGDEPEKDTGDVLPEIDRPATLPLDPNPQNLPGNSDPLVQPIEAALSWKELTDRGFSRETIERLKQFNERVNEAGGVTDEPYFNCQIQVSGRNPTIEEVLSNKNLPVPPLDIRTIMNEPGVKVSVKADRQDYLLQRDGAMQDYLEFKVDIPADSERGRALLADMVERKMLTNDQVKNYNKPGQSVTIVTYFHNYRNQDYPPNYRVNIKVSAAKDFALRTDGVNQELLGDDGKLNIAGWMSQKEYSKADKSKIPHFHWYRGFSTP